MDDKYAELLHTRTGNFHAAWQSAADDLLIASQVLKERAESFDANSLAAGDPIPVEGRLAAVEIMLKGMAVECLLKALWLKRVTRSSRTANTLEFAVRGTMTFHSSRLRPTLPSPI